MFCAGKSKMDESSIAQRSRSRFDRIVIVIGGLIIIAMAIASFNVSVLEDATFGAEEILDSFICAAALVWGLCCIFPSSIGTRPCSQNI